MEPRRLDNCQPLDIEFVSGRDQTLQFADLADLS